MGTYNFKTVEKKWQDVWEKEGIYKTSSKKGKKRYILDMFPYPSGASMHVGHLEGYVGTDILTRYLRMKGFNILHPMGWDAFGLPAENYAIKTGIHPDKETHKNIEKFKKQLNASGLSYDWDKEIDTSSPEFYKWTQWIFIKFFEKGLVYKKKSAVNWCPKDETVLANEQVIDGKCERCDTSVVKKDLEQWFFKITDYADRLIDGLDGIDWLEEVKTQQKNWIGRKEGRTIKFGDTNANKTFKIFTTRPETLNSVTFLAIASDKNKFTGRYVVNPINNEKIPVWEADYVSFDYGTGAIMGVPAYDEKDALFAKKYHIDVVKRDFLKEIIGEKTVNYHLRDWLISRQRYWGCPIPMIYCESCSLKDHTLKGQTLKGMAGWYPVPKDQLPVLLPTDVDFLPHGESPIARSSTFQKDVVCPSCGKPAKREVDTMDTYVDSSWYFLRFCDPKNTKKFADKKKIIAVDDYVGGGHVIQHLLFARFFWKVLFDLGYIDKNVGDEPFLKLRAPGWILGPDSRKMSKRWGNVVTPDDIFTKFGADTLRVYEMFMGPFDVAKPWSITGVEGSYRFLGRVWRLFHQNTDSGSSLLRGPSAASRSASPDQNLILSKMHKTIKKVGEDIENYKFNTAISSIMEFVNELSKYKVLNTKYLVVLAQLLAPFAPHMMEEVWHNVLGYKSSVHLSDWPKYDPKYLIENEITIAIQINGKLRSTITIKPNLSESDVLKLAKADKKVSKWLSGTIEKEIFIPNKLVNFVI
ncbi:MAG: class I tRNA ligase family protein [Patescibacteria group bacterium]